MQATKKSNKTQTLGFYKENGLWYADLPRFLALGLGSKADLLMVDGSDTFLDLLSSNTSSVSVRLSTEPFKNHTIHLEKLKIGLNQNLLDLIGHAPVSHVAYYIVKKYHDQTLEHTLWLCPVAEYVFQGKYPQNIYLTKK